MQGNGQAVVNVDLNGRIIRSFTWDLECNNTCFQFPFQTFDLMTPPSFWPSDSVVYEASSIDLNTQRSRFPVCSTPVFDDFTDTARMTILVGRELGKLVDFNSDLVDSLTFRYVESNFNGAIPFQASSSVPEDGGVVAVELSVGAISRILSFGVVAQLHRFGLTLEHDSIPHRQPSAIFVQAKDLDGVNVTISDTVRLSFRTDGHWGAFIAPNGDTILPASPQSHVELHNVLYGDARTGRVRFAALGENPHPSATVPIHVEAERNRFIRGDTSIVVLGSRLRFTPPPANAIYPTYPNRNDTTAGSPTKNWINLELKATLGDSTAIPNAWVRIAKPSLVDSGGHSHNGNRPMGTFRYPVDSTTSMDTLRVQTDNLGRVSFRYVASQFGGIERLRAWLENDTTKWDTLTMATRVPGLALLPDRTNYVKVGGTCEHHGPRDDSSLPNCRTPDNNHWGTALLIQYLTVIADSFSTHYPGHRLRINDMSLPLGGGFDIHGRWDQDIASGTCLHCGHRIGSNGDISYDVLNPQGTRVRMTNPQLLRLERFINAVSGAPVVHSDHFHVQ
jgi:hypothetical protein